MTTPQKQPCPTCQGKERIMHIYPRPGGPPGNQMLPCPTCQAAEDKGGEELSLADALEKALSLVNVAIPGRDCSPEREAIVKAVAALRSLHPTTSEGQRAGMVRPKRPENCIFSMDADTLAGYSVKLEDYATALEQKLREADGNLGMARAWIAQRGLHSMDCGLMTQKGPCSCGYKQALGHTNLDAATAWRPKKDFEAKLQAAESKLAEEKAKVHQLCIGRDEYNRVLMDFDPTEAGANYLEGGIRAIKRAKQAEAEVARLRDANEAIMHDAMDKIEAAESSKAALEWALEIAFDRLDGKTASDFDDEIDHEEYKLDMAEIKAALAKKEKP